MRFLSHLPLRPQFLAKKSQVFTTSIHIPSPALSCGLTRCPALCSARERVLIAGACIPRGLLNAVKTAPHGFPSGFSPAGCHGHLHSRSLGTGCVQPHGRQGLGLSSDSPGYWTHC